MKGRNSATGTANTELFPATPSHQWDVSSIVIYNASATPTAVTIKSGTTSIYGPIPAPPLGGAVVSLPVDPVDGAVGEAINFAASDAVTTIYVSATARMRHASSPVSASISVSSPTGASTSSATLRPVLPRFQATFSARERIRWICRTVFGFSPCPASQV